MAHEIRNTLVAIKTFAELLPTRWEDADFRGDFLVTAQEEIERIDRLLRDLMMLSKPADAVVDKVNVNAVCQSVARSLSARAESRGISLDTAFTSNGRYPIGDESRVHQALLTHSTSMRPGALSDHDRAGHSGGRNRPDHNTSLNANSLPAGAVQRDIRCSTPVSPADRTGLAICQTIIEEHNGHLGAFGDGVARSLSSSYRSTHTTERMNMVVVLAIDPPRLIERLRATFADRLGYPPWRRRR